MKSNLVERLRDWMAVWPEDDEKPEGSLFIEAADRIEELEAKLAKPVATRMGKWDELVDPAREALEALIAEGDAMADRIEELTKVLEEVDAWVDGLAPYADFEAEPAPVCKRVKSVLGRGYK